MKNQDEPILETDLGTWWGRTCTGQAIYLDYDVQELAYQYSHDERLFKKGGCLMLKAFYFALCYVLAMFGLLVITQINFWLGLSMFVLFVVKFMLQLPTYEGKMIK